MKKWIGVIILVIVGIIALVVAIEYLTHPIHTLPSILGGKHIRGHYQKRGYAALVVAIVALGGAVFWAVRIRRDETSGGASPPPAVRAGGAAPAETTDSLLGSAPAPAPAPEDS